jgi:hypothetical protein
MVKKTKTKKTVFACPTCKSVRIQATRLVRINTDEVMETSLVDKDGYQYCENCDEQGDDSEPCHPFVEIPVEETYEAMQLAAIEEDRRHIMQEYGTRAGVEDVTLFLQEVLREATEIDDD